MTIGHYAPALLARSRFRDVPLWLFLVAAQVPEFVWMFLAMIGVEPTEPASILDASFRNIRVEMTYSHNLVPALLQAAVVVAVVRAIWKRMDVALACGALVVTHFLSDVVCGFEHQVLGPQSPRISLNTYGWAPTAAILAELLFAAACVVLYVRMERRRGRPLTSRKHLALQAVFALPILASLPVAERTLRELFAS